MYIIRIEVYQKTYCIEKREFYKIKKGKIEEKGTIPVKSTNGNRAPHGGHLGHSLSMWACLLL
jgi:hypothetical protein